MTVDLAWTRVPAELDDFVREARRVLEAERNR
jgi:hypothetical protein